MYRTVSLAGFPLYRLHEVVFRQKVKALCPDLKDNRSQTIVVPETHVYRHHRDPNLGPP